MLQFGSSSSHSKEQLTEVSHVWPSGGLSDPKRTRLEYLGLEPFSYFISQLYQMHIYSHLYLNINIQVTTVNVEESITVKHISHNSNVYTQSVYIVTVNL